MHRDFLYSTFYYEASLSLHRLPKPAATATGSGHNQASIGRFSNRDFCFEVHEEKQMMQQAFREIDAADLLIAEVSEKGIGVGIEIGYAAAKGKPVIYLRNASSEHSTTAAGSASHVIIYKNTADLVEKLTAILSITPF
jgi:nucleoside 2-deoxyribosyltransferase